MNQNFNTTLWLIESVLLMLGLMFALPLIRAIAGIALIAVSVLLPSRQSKFRAQGIALLPVMLRIALGLGTATLLTQPSAALAAPVVEQIHVVQPGETLWSIAAQRLSAVSSEPVTPQQIDHEWRRLWRENFSQIGTDPTRLDTGVTLHFQQESQREKHDSGAR